MKNELDPIIKAVAERYNFQIKYCDVLHIWTVKQEEMGCQFYWNSNYSTAIFFSDLKFFFFEVGKQMLMIG